MKFQRRQRTTFTRHQLEALHSAFKLNHYPELQFRLHLAKETGLEPSRIQVWFQNQRAKDRKRRAGVIVSSSNLTHLDQHSDSLSPVPATTNLFNQNNQILPHHDHLSTPICVFNSVTANEAAQAVSEGKFESILQYHQNKYGNQSTKNLLQVHERQYQFEASLSPQLYHRQSSRSYSPALSSQTQ